MVNLKEKTIYILLGPSGSGKTTLGARLKKLGVPELVSHTTREPRCIKDNIKGSRKEEHGEDYYFVDKDEFDSVVKYEYAEYDGAEYCLSECELKDKLKDSEEAFTIMDIEGSKQLKEKFPGDVKIIYIKMRFDDMISRMVGRGDPIDKVERRIKRAVNESEFENIKDADYVIDNTGPLNFAIEQLYDIFKK